MRQSAQITSREQHDLVVQHAPLVRRIAQHLASRLPASVQIDDLMQAGMIGLLEAARNYDADQGASFETYAGIRIRGETNELEFRNNVIRDTRTGTERTQTVGILIEETVGNVILEENEIEAKVPIEDRRPSQPR